MSIINWRYDFLLILHQTLQQKPKLINGKLFTVLLFCFQKQGEYCDVIGTGDSCDLIPDGFAGQSTNIKAMVRANRYPAWFSAWLKCWCLMISLILSIQAAQDPWQTLHTLKQRRNKVLNGHEDKCQWKHTLCHIYLYESVIQGHCGEYNVPKEGTHPGNNARWEFHRCWVDVESASCDPGWSSDNATKYWLNNPKIAQNFET